MRVEELEGTVKDEITHKREEGYNVTDIEEKFLKIEEKMDITILFTP